MGNLLSIYKCFLLSCQSFDVLCELLIKDIKEIIKYSVGHSESWRNEGCNEVIFSKEIWIDYSDSEDNFPRKVWELPEVWK